MKKVTIKDLKEALSKTIFITIELPVYCGSKFTEETFETEIDTKDYLIYFSGTVEIVWDRNGDDFEYGEVNLNTLEITDDNSDNYKIPAEFEEELIKTFHFEY